MNILVIGGSGFLGSHTCDHLIKEGHKVINFDLKESKWKNDKINFVRGDICNQKDLTSIKTKIDIVYSFGGLADLNHALHNPLETYDLNIKGTINILNFCLKKKFKRFIFASTIYVNSNEGGFYKCSKQASEGYIKEFSKIYKLDYTILRFGSLYGSRSDNSNGVFNIIKEAVEKNKIFYNGDPEAIREYVHVIDAASACVSILGKNYKDEIVTITGNTPIKVIDFLNIVAEILSIKKNSIKFIKKKYPGHYIRTPYYYEKKIAKKLSPSSHIDFGQGIIELIDYLNKK